MAFGKFSLFVRKNSDCVIYSFGDSHDRIFIAAKNVNDHCVVSARLWLLGVAAVRIACEAELMFVYMSKD